jgi:GT2 family glycosyltransferase
LYIRGVTYGAFRPDEAGNEYHNLAVIERDFDLMAANGITAVRIPHTTPPRALLDIAQRHGLRVMVGLSAEQYVGYLIDQEDAPDIEELVRAKVRICAGHPALLCYAIGNEIPAAIVRWLGHRRVERYLRRIYEVVKAEDPDGLVTYVNYPTTEYLRLPFLDLLCFNVYLESQDRLEAYLPRLQNIAGDRPLIMSEVGLDSLRNGQEAQAQVLDWQVRTAFAAGCAGAFIFAWTDEWYRAGADVADWEFGLTDWNRRPKPALSAVREAFAEAPFPPDLPWPRVSVVVCSFNGGRTIRDCCEGLMKLAYPDFEVIVVNDGSVDATAAIAGEYDFQVIRTENRGLSNARNTGLAAATGEIVAYIDDDAYPDPHWLTYLASTFMNTNYVGVGGPNITPPGDGPIADCVANSPGNPTHILLSDQEAEHIPGCNMAFRKTALEAIGGFDPQFRVAGDDVDVCWRLRQRGWSLGFSPAAMVWHHRRNSIRAYLKQQVGYGRAEAMLEKKWPEKYNPLGHPNWAGRIYGAGLTRALLFRRPRIYHGTWGNAPFQSIYETAPGTFLSLPQMPEWYLIVFILLGLSALGALWGPLLLTLPLLALAVSLPLMQAGISASQASFPTESAPRRASSTSQRISESANQRIGEYPPERGTRVLSSQFRIQGSELRTRTPKGISENSELKNALLRGLTVFLHLLQPAARLWGRLRADLTPWRRHLSRGENSRGAGEQGSRGVGECGTRSVSPLHPRTLAPLHRSPLLSFPRPRTCRLWSEQWRAPETWLESIEAALRAQSVAVLSGGDYDRWDLEVRGGLFGSVRTCVAVEDHGSGAQLIRLRMWPRFALPGLLLTLLLALLAVMAAMDQAWPAAVILGVVAIGLAIRAFGDCAVAMASHFYIFKSKLLEEQFGTTEELWLL